MKYFPSTLSLFTRISQALLRQGFSVEDAAILLEDLDENLHEEIIDEIIDSLSVAQREKLAEMTTEALSDTAYQSAIGISPDTIDKLYVQRLEAYLRSIPGNLPAIRDTLDSLK